MIEKMKNTRKLRKTTKDNIKYYTGIVPETLDPFIFLVSVQVTSRAPIKQGKDSRATGSKRRGRLHIVPVCNNCVGGLIGFPSQTKSKNHPVFNCKITALLALENLVGLYLKQRYLQKSY